MICGHSRLQRRFFGFFALYARDLLVNIHLGLFTSPISKCVTNIRANLQ